MSVFVYMHASVQMQDVTYRNKTRETYQIATLFLVCLAGTKH